MKKILKLTAFALAITALNASAAHAWGGRHFRSTQPTTASTQQGYVQQGYARQAAPASNVWPYAPNYGNAVGAAYSQAAGMRQGQFFGTFGLRPADARARGAY